MKKITTRAASVLLLAMLVIMGMNVYILRYIDQGRSWALTFARLNTESTGTILDRNGELLAYFDANRNEYSSDQTTRIANYHVTGDYWGRSATGVLTAFWSEMQGYSLLTGTTHNENSVLNLTIDAQLNRVAYYAIHDQKAAVMMMNYRTGEVMVMVSTPAVDPADPNEIPADGAYINRCLSASFAPGSVFKLVTAAAAIETLPDMFERSFYCEGEYEVAGVPITCIAPHYTQTFEQALSNSCNVAFAQIAIRVGQDTLVKYVRDFGFLDRQSLNGIRTAAGRFPTEFVGDPELGWAGVGQSTDMVCPYAMLRFVAAIGNDGVLCEPTLLLNGDDPVRSRFVDASTAQRLGEMMHYNVVSHYGGDESFPGLRLCAKTGTAERGDGTNNSWFVGFLDDDAHPYAFVVMVEGGSFGITSAAPIANAFLQAAVKKY